MLEDSIVRGIAEVYCTGSLIIMRMFNATFIYFIRKGMLVV